MPKDLSGLAEGVYYHVYNIGVEKRVIFNDEQDYEVFLTYLEDYLTTPADRESTKKTFTVHGRTFRGTPHQPKNYFNAIELTAYSLTPNHFHLLINQKIKGSLESFIRSLCTRYSMYFNKKYSRTGSLFEGPYKSIRIESPGQLVLLTRYIHSHSPDKYSSLPEYSGKRMTSWVNTEVIHSLEKQGLESRAELAPGITLEKENQDLERRDLAPSAANPTVARPRKFEVFASFVIFLALFGFGLRNINITRAHSVLSESTQATPIPQLSPTPEPSAKTLVQIKITDGQEFVNIRQNPTTASEKIGQARDSETFEFVSVSNGWYGVKLGDDSTGFISTRYAFPVEGGNQ